MINYSKIYCINFSFFRNHVIKIYSIILNFYFRIFKLFNISFFYILRDKSKVKFFPKGQIAEVLFFNRFEKKELEIFQLLQTNGSTLIDVGANIGLYSIIGSKLVGPKGRVFAFEPSKSTFNLLLNNIKLNKFQNIFPINKGLGENIDESVIMYHNVEGEAENFSIKTENMISNLKNEIIILDTLDNFQIKNNIKKIDFLKVDVEGYESFVFKGAENLLRNNLEIIILFECADHLVKRAGASQVEVFDFLNSLGIDIAYWNEKDEKWSYNRDKAMKSGQLLGGRNIISRLNDLSHYL